MAGLYLHIPFCKRLCAYCDFYKSADLRRMDEVVEALHRELEAQVGFLHDRTLRTIYFGGGTPSLCAPEAVGALIDHAVRRFDRTELAECTLEANPDDLTDDYLRQLRRTPVDRLSIGVQSLDDGALRLMNRRHTAAQAVDAVRRAQDAGFGNLTVDLIFGIPGFGGDSLCRSLEGILSLGVQHVSAYHLTVEPATLFGRRAARGEFRPVEEATSEAEYLAVHRTLTAAGFEHYEISNYALPGRRARHNAGYWHGEEYLGLGPAAHSYNGEERRWAVASVDRYLCGGAIYESERPTPDERYDEWIMTALRTVEGADPAEAARRFGAARRDYLLRMARPHLEAGTLVRRGERLAVPPERFLVADAVIADLFWEGC